MENLGSFNIGFLCTAPPSWIITGIASALGGTHSDSLGYLLLSTFAIGIPLHFVESTSPENDYGALAKFKTTPALMGAVAYVALALGVNSVVTNGFPKCEKPEPIDHTKTELNFSSKGRSPHLTQDFTQGSNPIISAYYKPVEATAPATFEKTENTANKPKNNIRNIYGPTAMKPA